MIALRPTLTTLVLAAVIAPLAAHAQQPQGAPQGTTPAATTATTPPVNAAAELAIKEMTARLRTVLIAQEGHYSDHGTYTTSMTSLGRYESSLAMPKPPKPGAAPIVPVRRDSVSVQIIFAGGRGWTGIASHWGLRGRSCVVYVGMPEELPKVPITRADRRAPAEEGVPACDSAPPPGATPTPTPPAPQPVVLPPAAQPPRG
jgi:hypothetical protein